MPRLANHGDVDVDADVAGVDGRDLVAGDELDERGIEGGELGRFVRLEDVLVDRP